MLRLIKLVQFLEDPKKELNGFGIELIHNGVVLNLLTLEEDNNGTKRVSTAFAFEDDIELIDIFNVVNSKIKDQQKV